MKHYTVTAIDGGYVFGLAKFANVTQFLEHFESQPLLGGESGDRLLNILFVFFKPDIHVLVYKLDLHDHKLQECGHNFVLRWCCSNNSNVLEVVNK